MLQWQETSKSLAWKEFIFNSYKICCGWGNSPVVLQMLIKQAKIFWCITSLYQLVFSLSSRKEKSQLKFKNLHLVPSLNVTLAHRSLAKTLHMVAPKSKASSTCSLPLFPAEKRAKYWLTVHNYIHCLYSLLSTISLLFSK